MYMWVAVVVVASGHRTFSLKLMLSLQLYWFLMSIWVDEEFNLWCPTDPIQSHHGIHSCTLTVCTNLLMLLTHTNLIPHAVRINVYRRSMEMVGLSGQLTDQVKDVFSFYSILIEKTLDSRSLLHNVHVVLAVQNYIWTRGRQEASFRESYVFQWRIWGSH